ncbi:MAG: HEAT repeat domain-containing protein [archaeon]
MLPRFFVIWLLLVPLAFADGTLTGMVSDASGDAVPFATVQIVLSDGTKTGTITNDLGEYSINLPAASYGVTVTSIGYEPVAHKIALADESTLLLDIALPYSAVEMNEVIVRGNFDPDDMLLYLDTDVVEPGADVVIGVDENTRGIGESIVTYRYSIESFRKPDGSDCSYESANPHEKFTCISGDEGIFSASVDLVFGDDTYSQTKLISVSRERRISRAVANLNVLSVSATDSDGAAETYRIDLNDPAYRCSPQSDPECAGSNLYCAEIDEGCRKWRSHFSSEDFDERSFNDNRQLRLKSGTKILLTAAGSKIDGENIKEADWYFVDRDDLFSAPTLGDLRREWLFQDLGAGKSIVNNVVGSRQGYIVGVVSDGWKELMAFIPVQIFGNEPASDAVYNEELADVGVPLAEKIIPGQGSRCVESDVSPGYEGVSIYNSAEVDSFCVEQNADGEILRRIDDRVVDGENQETYCDEEERCQFDGVETAPIMEGPTLFVRFSADRYSEEQIELIKQSLEMAAQNFPWQYRIVYPGELPPANLGTLNRNIYFEQSQQYASVGIPVGEASGGMFNGGAVHIFKNMYDLLDGKTITDDRQRIEFFSQLVTHALGHSFGFQHSIPHSDALIYDVMAASPLALTETQNPESADYLQSFLDSGFTDDHIRILRIWQEFDSDPTQEMHDALKTAIIEQPGAIMGSYDKMLFAFYFDDPLQARIGKQAGPVTGEDCLTQMSVVRGYMALNELDRAEEILSAANCDEEYTAFTAAVLSEYRGEGAARYEDYLKKYCEGGAYCDAVANRMRLMTAANPLDEERAYASLESVRMDLNEFIAKQMLAENKVALLLDIQAFLNTFPQSRHKALLQVHKLELIRALSKDRTLYPDEPIGYPLYDEDVFRTVAAALSATDDPELKERAYFNLFRAYSEPNVPVQAAGRSSMFRGVLHQRMDEYFEEYLSAALDSETDAQIGAYYLAYLQLKKDYDTAFSYVHDYVYDPDKIEHVASFLNKMTSVFDGLDDTGMEPWFPLRAEMLQIAEDFDDDEIKSLAYAYAGLFQADPLLMNKELMAVITQYPGTMGADFALKWIHFRQANLPDIPFTGVITPINPIPDVMEIDISNDEPIEVRYRLSVNRMLLDDPVVVPEFVDLDTGEVIYDSGSDYDVSWDTVSGMSYIIKLRLRRTGLFRESDKQFRLKIYVGTKDVPSSLAYQQDFTVRLIQARSSCEQYMMESAGNEGDVRVYMMGESYANLDEFMHDIETVVDEYGQGRGLFATEPFRSMKDRFSIYYNPQVYRTTVVPENTFQGSDRGHEIPLINDLLDECEADVKVILSKRDNRAHALFRGTMGLDTGIGWVYKTVDNRPLNIDSVFVHELGHAFADLADEYDKPEERGWSPVGFIFNPRDNPNIAETVAKAREKWGDLEFLGIRRIRVGFFERMIRNDVRIIPTPISIMNDHTKLRDVEWEYGFGPVNERCLVKVILEGGYCDDAVVLRKYTPVVKYVYENGVSYGKALNLHNLRPGAMRDASFDEVEADNGKIITDAQVMEGPAACDDCVRYFSHNPETNEWVLGADTDSASISFEGNVPGLGTAEGNNLNLIVNPRARLELSDRGKEGRIPLITVYIDEVSEDAQLAITNGRFSVAVIGDGSVDVQESASAGAQTDFEVEIYKKKSAFNPSGWGWGSDYSFIREFVFKYDDCHVIDMGLNFEYPISIGIHDGPGIAVYFASQGEGERALVGLARGQDREDAWAFIDRDDPLWIDIGREAEERDPDAYSPVIYPEYGFLPEVLRPGDRVTVYHIHPDPTYNDAFLLDGRPATQNYMYNLPSHLDYVLHDELAHYFEKVTDINPSRVVGAVFAAEFSADDPDPEELEIELHRIAQDTLSYPNVNPISERLAEYSSRVNGLGVYFRILDTTPSDAQGLLPAEEEIVNNIADSRPENLPNFNPEEVQVEGIAGSAIACYGFNQMPVGAVTGLDDPNCPITLEMSDEYIMYEVAYARQDYVKEHYWESDNNRNSNDVRGEAEELISSDTIVQRDKRWFEENILSEINGRFLPVRVASVKVMLVSVEELDDESVGASAYYNFGENRIYYNPKFSSNIGIFFHEYFHAYQHELEKQYQQQISLHRAPFDARMKEYKRTGDVSVLMDLFRLSKKELIEQLAIRGMFHKYLRMVDPSKYSPTLTLPEVSAALGNNSGSYFYGFVKWFYERKEEQRYAFMPDYAPFLDNLDNCNYELFVNYNGIEIWLEHFDNSAFTIGTNDEDTDIYEVVKYGAYNPHMCEDLHEYTAKLVQTIKFKPEIVARAISGEFGNEGIYRSDLEAARKNNWIKQAEYERVINYPLGQGVVPDGGETAPLCTNHYTLHEEDDCWDMPALCIEEAGECVTFEDMRWDERVLENVLLLIGQDSGVKRDAAAWLRTLDPPKDTVGPIAIRILDEDPDEFVKLKMVEILGKMRSLEAVDSIMHTLEGTNDFNLMLACLTSLGEISSQKAVPLLDRLLEQDDRNGIISQTVSSLIKIGSPESYKALFDELEKEDNDLVRGLIAMGLAEADSPQAVQALVRTVRSDKNQEIRIFALESLNQIGSPDMFPSLTELWESEENSPIHSKLSEVILENLDGLPENSPYLRSEKIFALLDDALGLQPDATIEVMQRIPLFKKAYDELYDKIYHSDLLGRYSSAYVKSKVDAMVLPVYRYIKSSSGDYASMDEISSGIDYILSKRDEFEDKVILGKSTYLIHFTHDEKRSHLDVFSNENIENFARARGVTKVADSNLKGADSKNTIRRLIRDSRGDTVIWFHGHGGKESWGLSEPPAEVEKTKGLRPEMIHYSELGDDLFERNLNENISNVIIIADTCLSYDYASNLLDYLKNVKRMREFPAIITVTNKGRYGSSILDITKLEKGVTSVFLESVKNLGISAGSPLRGGDIYEAETANFEHQDLAVFFFGDGSFPVEIAMNSLNHECSGGCTGDYCPILNEGSLVAASGRPDELDEEYAMQIAEGLLCSGDMQGTTMNAVLSLLPITGNQVRAGCMVPSQESAPQLVCIIVRALVNEGFEPDLENFMMIVNAVMEMSPEWQRYESIMIREFNGLKVCDDDSECEERCYVEDGFGICEGSIPGRECGCVIEDEISLECEEYTHVILGECDLSEGPIDYVRCLTGMTENGYAMRGDSDELCLLSTAEFSSDPDELRTQGKFTCIDLSVAMSYFGKAYENADDETRAFIHYNRARCYESHGVFEDAIEEYKNAWIGSENVNTDDRLDFMRDASFLLGKAYLDYLEQQLQGIVSGGADFSIEQAKRTAISSLFWLKRARALGGTEDSQGYGQVDNYIDIVHNILDLFGGFFDVDELIDAMLVAIDEYDVPTDDAMTDAFEQELTENDLDAMNIFGSNQAFMDLTGQVITDPTERIRSEFEERRRIIQQRVFAKHQREENLKLLEEQLAEAARRFEIEASEKIDYEQLAEELSEQTGEVSQENPEESALDVVPEPPPIIEEIGDEAPGVPGGPGMPGDGGGPGEGGLPGRSGGGPGLEDYDNSGMPGPKGRAAYYGTAVTEYNPDDSYQITNSDNDWADRDGNYISLFEVNPPGSYYLVLKHYTFMNRDGNPVRGDYFQTVKYPVFRGSDSKRVIYTGTGDYFMGGYTVKDLATISPAEGEYYVDPNKIEAYLTDNPQVRLKYQLFIGRDKTPILVLDRKTTEKLTIKYELVKVEDADTSGLNLFEPSTYAAERIVAYPPYQQMEREFTESYSDYLELADGWERHVRNYFYYEDNGTAQGTDWFKTVFEKKEADCDGSNQIFNVGIRKNGIPTKLTVGWITTSAGHVYQKMTGHGWSTLVFDDSIRRFDATASRNMPQELTDTGLLDETEETEKGQLTESDVLKILRRIRNPIEKIMRNDQTDLLMRLTQFDSYMESELDPIIRNQGRLPGSYDTFENLLTMDEKKAWNRAKGAMMTQISLALEREGKEHYAEYYPTIRALFIKYSWGTDMKYDWNSHEDLDQFTSCGGNPSDEAAPIQIMATLDDLEHECYNFQRNYWSFVFPGRIYDDDGNIIGRKSVVTDALNMGLYDEVEAIMNYMPSSIEGDYYTTFVDVLRTAENFEIFADNFTGSSLVMEDAPKNVVGFFDDNYDVVYESPSDFFIEYAFPEDVPYDDEDVQNQMDFLLMRTPRPSEARAGFSRSMQEICKKDFAQLAGVTSNPARFNRQVCDWFDRMSFDDVLEGFEPYQASNDYADEKALSYKRHEFVRMMIEDNEEGFYALTPFLVIERLRDEHKKTENYDNLISIGVSKIESIDIREPLSDLELSLAVYYVNKALEGLQRQFADDIISLNEIVRYRSIVAIANAKAASLRMQFNSHHNPDDLPVNRIMFDNERFNDLIINFFAVENSFEPSIFMVNFALNHQALKRMKTFFVEGEDGSPVQFSPEINEYLINEGFDFGGSLGGSWSSTYDGPYQAALLRDYYGEGNVGRHRVSDVLYPDPDDGRARFSMEMDNVLKNDLRLKSISRMVRNFPQVYPYMWDLDNDGPYFTDSDGDGTLDTRHESRTAYYYTYYKELMTNLASSAYDIVYHEGSYDDGQARSVAPLILYGAEDFLADERLSKALSGLSDDDKTLLRWALKYHLTQYIINELYLDPPEWGEGDLGLVYRPVIDPDTGDAVKGTFTWKVNRTVDNQPKLSLFGFIFEFAFHPDDLTEVELAGPQMEMRALLTEDLIERFAEYQQMIDKINKAYGFDITLSEMGFRLDCMTLGCPAQSVQVEAW